MNSLDSLILNMDYRTGGDTPADDGLVINGAGQANMFGFANTFSNYSVSMNLLDHFSAIDILNTIKASGELEFFFGNDSSPYLATLDISGSYTPSSSISEPYALGLFGLGFLALGVRRRLYLR